MAAQTFDTVWYLPNENRWRDLNLLAYRDVLRVSYGKQGRDFVNNWVKVEYGHSATPSSAFFADGSLRGWGGISGGAKRILDAVRRLV